MNEKTEKLRELKALIERIFWDGKCVGYELVEMQDWFDENAVLIADTPIHSMLNDILDDGQVTALEKDELIKAIDAIKK